MSDFQTRAARQLNTVYGEHENLSRRLQIIEACYAQARGSGRQISVDILHKRRGLLVKRLDRATWEIVELSKIAREKKTARQII